jgi:hypothetical protein
MRKLLSAVLIFLIGTGAAFAQKEKPPFSFCGNTGNCTMTWEEFMSCKKELVPNNSNIKIGSFMLTIMKAEKKDTISIEYASKGNVFSKSAVESIAALHKKKKMGNKVVIDAVQVLESGKDARRAPGMVITLK